MLKIEKLQNCRFSLKVTKYDWPEIHVYDGGYDGPRMFSSSINNAVTVIAGSLQHAMDRMRLEKKEGLVINFTFIDSVQQLNPYDESPENQMKLFDED